MNKRIKRVVSILKDSGVFLLMLLGCILVVSGISLLLKISICKYHLFFNIMLSIVLFLVLKRDKKILRSCICILIGLLVLVFSILINKNYLDISWDGNTYHKDAIGLLKNGWNPIYENYIDAYKKIDNRNMDYIGETIENTHGFWQTHYAKGTWLIGANIYSVTNDIEMGKAYNLLIIYITFVLLLYILYKHGSNFVLSLIIAILAAVNPIILVQTFTYYNDGFLGNLLILLVALMILFNEKKKILSKEELYACICLVLILLINTKFTGFAYAGIFCLAYYLVYLYNKFKTKNLKDAIKPTVIFSITVLTGVVIVGFSPYIINIFNKDQIFYPLMGDNKVDIVTHNQPIKFQNKPTIYKAPISLLSRVVNSSANSPRPIIKKIPFTIYPDEIESLGACDLRISGFGVLFSGILILSVVVCAISLVTLYRKKDKYFVLLGLPLIVVCGLMLFISESWWARYTPYLYMIPIIALVLLTRYKKPIKYFIFGLLSLLMFINIGIFVRYNTIENYKYSKEITSNINKLPKEEIIIVDTVDEFVGVMYNFEDKDINFNVSTKASKQDRALYKWVKYRLKEVKQ